MNNQWGFVRVAAAVPNVFVADAMENAKATVELVLKAQFEHVQVVAFPELGMTAYTCADLFFQQRLLQDAEKAVEYVLQATADVDTVVLVGAPCCHANRLYNCALVLHKGRIMGIVPKTYIPNNNEFYEKRWFASARDCADQLIDYCGQQVPFGADLIFRTADFQFGIEICEDLWAPVPPSSQLALQGADVVFNLSASNEVVGKALYRRELVLQQSARTLSGYVYVSAGWGESSTDLVFAGDVIMAENGAQLAESERFSMEPQLIVSEMHVERLRAERLRNGNFFNDKTNAYRMVNIDNEVLPFDKLHRKINPHPFIPLTDKRSEVCNEILDIQVAGLARRWQHTHAETLVLGISGGLDSTLALLVCVRACDKLKKDRRKVIGITMPGFGTTDRTYNNALLLMDALGVTRKEISIKEAALQHFKDIQHDVNQHDVTYENTQARERTQILMDVANQTNGLVIGTGDLSELALGWATYNGDQMSMYGVNAGVPKTLVRYLVEYAALHFNTDARTVLMDVLDTPVSPELLPADAEGKIAQKTEDLVGPYELHDFFLFHTLRYGFTKEKIAYLARLAFEGVYDEATIAKWLNTFFRRFFMQQFKRSCMPDGPKVGSVNLSPRGDWRMPSDAYCWK